MNSLSVSIHGTQRASQRNFSASDLNLALLLGREVESGCLVLDKDAQRLAACLEDLARKVRKLVGVRIVLDREAVRTAYLARPGKQKRLLRHAEQRNLED